MSLDFYLLPHANMVAVPEVPTKEMEESGLIAFLGHDSIGAAWEAMLKVGGQPIEAKILFERNITHNLTAMADAAGIYKCLWRPDENGITKASQMVEPLREGLKRLKEYPEYYSAFNASNGWGTYDAFVPFVEAVLEACIANPEAKVEVSR